MNIIDHSPLIKELTTKAHATAVDKGWHENTERMPNNIVLKAIVYILRTIAHWLSMGGKVTARQRLAWLALITSELDEAALAGSPMAAEDEAADFFIRVLDAKGALGYNRGISEQVYLETIEEARDLLVRKIRHGTDLQEDWDELLHVICTKHDRTLLNSVVATMLKNVSRPHRHGGLKA